MVDCKYHENGTCAIIAYLAACDRSLCHVSDDACRVCLQCERPQTLNRVTASIGLTVARAQHTGEKLIEIRNRLSPYITVEQPKPVVSGGPGTELKHLLAKAGFRESKGCGCKSHAREMDHKGTEWCEQNIDMIIGWLRDEASRQSLPFVELAARALIRYAIRRAKAKK